jgi:hypothetical protein
MSRLGLFCTADSPLMDIPLDSQMISTVGDLYTVGEDGYGGKLMLTDGAVRIYTFIHIHICTYINECICMKDLYKFFKDLDRFPYGTSSGCDNFQNN